MKNTIIAAAALFASLSTAALAQDTTNPTNAPVATQQPQTVAVSTNARLTKPNVDDKILRDIRADIVTMPHNGNKAGQGFYIDPTEAMAH
jgi:hypothetical protein